MSEEFNDDMSSVDDSFNDSSSEIESDIEDSVAEAEAEANEFAEEQAAEMEAEAQEAQAEAEAEANEIAEEQAAEMEAEAQAEANEIAEEQVAEMEAEAQEAQAEAEAEANEIAEEQEAEMEAEAEEVQAEAETGEREDDISTLYCKNKDEEQYDMDGEERFRVPSEENEECYGHGGDGMTTYDPYASYPESHFPETDERYMDEQAEMTEATNQKALRELAEFQRLQDEEAEQEAEAQRQAEVEAEERAALEADVQAQADALNKEYIDLMDRKQAAFDSTVDATNIEDRDRFANIQYEIGKEMEQVRSKIIENNNRLK